MEITDVRVFPVDEEKLKAFVSIIIDDCFVVSDIKVISGTSGLFISMPSKRRKNGTFRDIAHPLNSETRKRIEDKVLARYREAVAGKGPCGRPGTGRRRGRGKAPRPRRRGAFRPCPGRRDEGLATPCEAAVRGLGASSSGKTLAFGRQHSEVRILPPQLTSSRLRGTRNKSGLSFNSPRTEQLTELNNTGLQNR